MSTTRLRDIPARQRQVVLTGRPGAAGVTADLFKLVEGNVPLSGGAKPGDGQLLIRVLWLSLDPAMRGWIAETANYKEPVALGAVMTGFTVGEVVLSNHPDYQPGQLVYGSQGWQEWALSDGSDIHHKIDPSWGRPSLALGVLGHTGLTAYLGLLDVGQPRAGETVVISTAAGAVGSVVGQIARIKGCRVVGLTGSDAKVQTCLDEFGFDAAINYRSTPDLGASLDAACPDGIDVYFDNVAGEIFERVLERLNVRGRIVQNGTIAMVPGTLTAPVNRQILVKRARLEGFLVLDHFDRFPEAIADLSAWVAEGRIRHREDVMDGLVNAPHALVRLLKGVNEGKQILRVAPDAP